MNPQHRRVINFFLTSLLESGSQVIINDETAEFIFEPEYEKQYRILLEYIESGISYVFRYEKQEPNNEFNCYKILLRTSPN